MKRAVIVHCWEGYPDYCWYPWVQKELETKGFKVDVPEMPETNLPKLSRWVAALTEVIGEPDKDLYLIGHSLGCITIMRYLESLAEDEKIGGVVFVAGFTDPVGFQEIANFFETPIDFRKIKSKTESFIAINSDDDPYVALKYADILKEKLGAEVIVKHEMKHFSGPIENEESCLQLPDVVESIIQMSAS